MRETIDWGSTSDGVILPVLAQPGAKQHGVKGIRQGQLVVAVTPSPQHGQASEAIIAVLAEFLPVKPRPISLHSGATSARKQFLIQDSDLETWQQPMSRMIRTEPKARAAPEIERPSSRLPARL